MQSRPLPPAIKALVLQIDALIKNPDLNRDDFAGLKKFGLNELLSPMVFNGVTHSYAGWIHHACHQDILDWLYKHCDTNPDGNFFLLHWAIVCRQPEATIRTLAAYQRKHTGWNLYSDNTTTHIRYNGKTPLHIAIDEGNIDAVKTLAEFSSAIDATSDGDITPLHIAVYKQDAAMVKLLIDAHAKVDAKNRTGDTALNLAVNNFNPDIIQILLDAGANIFKPNYRGDTALHIAMQHNTEIANACFETLKPNNLSGFNLTNNAGQTPFTIAATENHVDILNYCLIPNQSEEHADDEKIGQHHIHLGLKLAAHNGHLDVINTLLPHIEDVKTECSEMKGSALSIAANRGHKEIVKVLCNKLLDDYITERDKGPDYQKYTYFFVKKGAGYSKERKLEAARALSSVLNGEHEKATLDKFYGPLHNKTLKTIFKIINKYVFENYQPSADHAAITDVQSPAGSNDYRASYSYSSRSRDDFSWLNDVGHAAETAACICSCVTNSGRGYGNGGCSVM